MDNYILSSRSSFPSAKILRNALVELGYPKLKVTYKASILKRNPIVRYGNSERILSGDDTHLNSMDFIHQLSDKNLFSTLLKEKVYVPIFSRELPKDTDFPIIVRKFMSACKGKGIVVCKNLEEYEKNNCRHYFWTHYVNLDFELRVHVIGGEIKKVFKKIYVEEEPEEEFPIRTSEHYHFSLVDPGKYKKLLESVDIVSEILGKDNFYALDIGWDKNKKKYFILEGNSAPGLNELTANLYAEYIKNSLERQGT